MRVRSEGMEGSKVNHKIDCSLFHMDPEITLSS